MRPSRLNRYDKCVKQAESYPYRIEMFNDDMQWRIRVPVVVDFWPHTGKYRSPDGVIEGVAADFIDFTMRVDQAIARTMVTG